MKSLLIVTLLLQAFPSFGSVPEPVLDHKNSYNGYGTFAGHLSAKPAEPLGITVDNGGVKFSTITDKEGNWAISFRQRVIYSDITAWSLSNLNESSSTLRAELR